jgi:F0F1-type ATP synthase membrane subunit c/vacuolar-type H+-ATPase subunit K
LEGLRVVLRKGKRGDAAETGAADRAAAGATKADATRPRAKKSTLKEMVMGMAWIEKVDEK